MALLPATKLSLLDCLGKRASLAPRMGVASMIALLLMPAVCSAGDTPSAGTRWRSPLTRLHVTSPFGFNIRPGGKDHKGTDLRAAPGTAVFSTAKGRVAVSSDRYGARYGKVVVIEHDDSTRTLYAHLDNRMVRSGQTVRAGQQIGLSGATGKVRGPHLHFEVLRQGKRVDPQAVLREALPRP